MGGNCGFFWFFFWGSLFLVCKWMSNVSMGGIGKWGKKKTLKKGYKSAHFFAEV